MSRWPAAVLAVLCMAGAAPAGAQPDEGAAAPTMPAFVPHPSDWTPDYTVWPYNLWQNRVTPEQVTAQRESCQWFNAQYDELMTQAFGFQRFLGDRRDDWTDPAVRATADVVVANLNQSAAFLQPRADTLFIVNYPDQSEYSPLFHGDSIYRLWYQLTQISDKISREVPAGQINANTATANVYGTVIRDSGVCAGA
ncbi:hypothetical protein [Mycolicibacterium duvalii]|uniref:Uncharacterized protein n=1 Tax=Mycolicibacterium duvalii TaxID=39688 RepID=A0A7I7K3X7_9MYCO|nr:hypothetical protein [Mycolicibacterium duvalii]MCV7367623.1 hypothetical protein [Mycolicibacterium duvalii]BBX18787.1 hypothetical protein MDUV_36470 [Mycolicibacterium duvalii]